MNFFKPIFALTVIILLSFSSKAQTDDVLYKNDFGANDSKWTIYTKENAKTYIKDGRYVLEHLKTKLIWYHPITLEINPSLNFDIRATLREVSGSRGSSYGFFWGGKDVNSAYFINLNDSGFFRVFYFENKIYNELMPWRLSKSVKKVGLDNKIHLQKKDGMFSIFVNDQLLYEMKFMDFFGSEMGLYAEEPIVMEVDNIEVRQVKKPIELIENYLKFGEREKLPETVNSSSIELMPVISHDGKMLFIDRSKHPENIGDEKKDDIWVSTLKSDSTWSHVKNIGFPLNNEGSNYVISVSPDNNTLLLGNVYDVNSKTVKGGISFSHRTKDGWSFPSKLSIKNYYTNHIYSEACLSPDRKAILLTLQRTDTHGQKDIYVSFYLEDSTWSEPKNIGDVVNTFADETSPFLAADGKTLYFSTSGHPGYGKNDIFVTRRLDDSWKKWSEPKNLGPKVNTVGWDAYYTVQASGEYAYMVSTNKDEINSDVYRIKQPSSAKPMPVALVHGHIYNSKTKEPMLANISYNELGEKKEIGSANSNPNTGAYSIILPVGKKYAYHALKEGFIAVHNNIDLSTLSAYKEVSVDLFLVPFEVGETILLNNLFFVANKYDLLPGSFAEIDQLYDMMKKNPKMQIEIAGHTSKNATGDKFNQDLSYNRANAVKIYLVSKGIKEDRIKAVGYGYTKPVDSIFDEAHQARNRRVEFTIKQK